MPDIVQKIMAYEAGALDDEHTLALFQELVDTGMDMQLQGSYGRTAARLIADGLIRGPWDEDEWMTTPTVAFTRDPYALWHRVQDQGGFTVDPFTGEIPTAGYAVSLPDFDRVYTLPDFHPAQVTHALQDAREAARIYPEFRIFAGAWLDPDSHHVITDASVVLHRLHGAERYARAWDQRDVYDLSHGVTVPVRYAATG